jgi:23S rRNA (adenine2503-C2)-methyltransferase
MNTGFQIGQRKITISTCGIIPGIIKWADFKNQTNLAISLHSPFQDKREEIMPIAKKYNLKELIDACQYFQKQTNRRITFEYALINKFNDREEDIKELIKIAGQVYCHINLIRLNDVEESMLVPSKKVKNVFNKLQSNGINCTIRRSVGKNIEAACGQLRHKIENANERG